MCNFSQLKAFYVDLIVPLESNIEKDTKVVQVRYSPFTFTLLVNIVVSLVGFVHFRKGKVTTVRGCQPKQPENGKVHSDINAKFD